MDSSFVATMAKLGVDLAEIPGWECCGNTAGHSANRLLAAALPANELAKVKDDMKLDAVAVPCAACFSRFQSGNHEVADDEALAADVAEVIGRPYTGGVTVLNMVDVYHDHVGLEALAAQVKKPFAGLKVASYYGCLLTRPPKVTLAEDPEYPVHMDAVLEAIGCVPVDWDSKTDCCGASLALCEQDIVDEFVKIDHRQRARLRRRGDRLRLPALPDQPRQPPGRDRQGRPGLAPTCRSSTSRSSSAARSASTATASASRSRWSTSRP